MRFTPSAALVRQSLSAHSWIGLLACALMYLICLSGTLAVFYLEFERWEQPDVRALAQVRPEVVERAVHELVERVPPGSDHVYLVFPTDATPALLAEAEEDAGWFVEADGSLGVPMKQDWTHLLIDLHLYLLMPETIGLLIVGVLGALLCALIVSGFLAHPRIFKDAFRLRLGGSRPLEQADIHNRLSVWGAPFHLMIAITGAYFGLYTVLAWFIGSALYGAGADSVTERIFGEEPVIEQPLRPLAIAEALDALESVAPGTTPIWLTVHEPGTTGQFIDIYSRHPDRLIYAEGYRFDAAGRYLGNLGYSDTETGRQVLYSTYRLHFGHFDSFAVKILYAVLGLALTVVAVTGTNVWLARRRKRDFLNPLWSGFVWGAPVAIAASAVTQILLEIPSRPVFWTALAACVGYSVRSQFERRAVRSLQYTCAAVIALLLVGYIVKFGESAFDPVALGVNASLAATAIAFWLLGYAPRRRSETSERPPSRAPLPDPDRS